MRLNFLELTREGADFILPAQPIEAIPVQHLQAVTNDSDELDTWEIRQAAISNNQLKATLHNRTYTAATPTIEIQQRETQWRLRCNCHHTGKKLCRHLYTAIREIQRNQGLQLAFDTKRRLQLLEKKASEYGWQSMEPLADLFTISYAYGRIHVETKIKLLSYTESSKRALKKQLLPTFNLPKPKKQDEKTFLLVEKPRYSDDVHISLMQAPTAQAKNGIKAPIEKVNLHDHIKQTHNHEASLFYLALFGLSNYSYSLDNYQQVIKNTANLDFYISESLFGNEKITPQKLQLLNVQGDGPTVKIHVKESGDFYIMTCFVHADGREHTSKALQLYPYLFIVRNTLYCLRTETENNVLQFFKKNNHQIYVQREQFLLFKEDFLDKLENSVNVSYSFIKNAPKRILKQQALDQVSRFIIYLSELDEFVLLTPTVSYGDVEVPVLSRRSIHTSLPDGTLYAIPRDEAIEQQFIRNIQAQHPTFESLPQTEFYYLHKRAFLDDDWFIHAFEAWRNEGYGIMGFNKLKNNRYNEHKISIKTSVQSGIDWFDIHTVVSFGEQQVSLRDIQKSIVNKSRFVELGDGTQGILPEEWISKFTHYFRSGEIDKDHIRTHKSNFQLIDELFEQELLSAEVQQEIIRYKEKLADFQAIAHVQVPAKLQATLRDYQKEGLNWLNFLDEFGFGGCLADDMGLGKTIQVIAYFLMQHEKGNHAPNLVVVPTSLLFNWQNELGRFAPHLRYLTLYGANRTAALADIATHDVILTTYGTLLADIEVLKAQHFNVIVLDESQAIKNPSSKRYKAVKLLNGRQRLALTGTPVENNTFDLFAQLSFVLPGLLGSAKRFATDYSTPIDKFQDGQRARELQRKIHPFILRRTKKQVAKELPEKTEMIVYCEMGTEQRRVYDTYKREFQKYLKGIKEDELQASNLHILQGLTKLRQLCNSPALLADDEFYGDQSAKRDELIDQLQSLKDTHKVLVFSQFVGMLDMIKSQLEQQNIGYAYLTGKTQNREEQVARFQQDETVRVFLISLKAGGTGLNLTQAAYVFLVDPWWNPAVENQAIDRAYRIGQQNKVVAVRFITPDSIEEKIMQLQQRKQQLAEELIHTDSHILKQLNKDDLLDLLA